jgi:YVTN family beta-propeller protein
MNRNVTRAALVSCVALVVLIPLIAFQQRPGPVRKGVRLHNGWQITPAGTHETTGDMLLGCAFSPDKKLLAMTNVGAAAHKLHLLDTATGKIRQSLPMARGWNGVAWSSDGAMLYVSGGTLSHINRFQRQSDGTYTPAESLKIPVETMPDGRKHQPWLAGLALSPDGKTLYAVDTAADTLYALALPDGTVKTKRKLADGARPYCLVFTPDGKTLAATQWALDSVLALNPETLETVRTLNVGRHPNALLFAGDRLFVSCGNDDMVAVLDFPSGQVKERIVTRPTRRAPAGSTPSALALSPDGKTLYVANADNNAVAVVDVSREGQSQVRGFIPTGWYPTAVAVSLDGKRLFVGSGKGLGTGPNPAKTLPIPSESVGGFPYIVSLLGGLISTIEIPDLPKLAAHTRQVIANSPYRDEYVERPNRAPRPGSNPIPSRLGDPSPIKYVLYIIKENRTYDQVLGDFKDHTDKPRGNGDPNLCLFGEEVSPNHHELARQFVLLDNFYCNGEVSVDGHHWTNGAYVPDFMARTWPLQYSGKGSPPLNPALSDTPNGRIWDQCEKKGVPYRTYYYHTQKNRSEEWAKARAAGRRDYDYVEVFIKEFQEFEKNYTLPRFMVMALSEDHTRGTTPGAFTPKACVASNDVALGKIVETISKSKYWKEFAIFVIEDDAQNGPDHVDAHRTVALAISPYTRRRHLDSTFYTTVSMLRTIELILGLPPMTQFDAGATPLYNAFTNKPDLTPYTVLPARINLQAKNERSAVGATVSQRLDFSEPDLLTVADEDALNRVLWHSIKGKQSPYPGVTRRALISPNGFSLTHFEDEEKEEEEDD